MIEDATLRMKRRVFHAFCDTVSSVRFRPSTERPVLLAGAPRSGTTWVMEMLGVLLDAFRLIEPFQLEELTQQARATLGSWRPYRDPDAVDRDLEALLRRFFAGNHLRNRPLQQLRPLVSGHRVVMKEVRLGFLLPYVLSTFPATDVVLLVRNPVGVVASQTRSAWSDIAELDVAYLEMAERFPDLLAPKIEPRSVVEVLATQWAMEHRYLEEMTPLDRVLLLDYADVIHEPRGSLLRILEHCASPPAAFARLEALGPELFERPSRSTNTSTGIIAKSAGERARETEADEAIRRVVDSYGDPFGMLAKERSAAPTPPGSNVRATV